MELAWIVPLQLHVRLASRGLYFGSHRIFW